MLVIEENFLKAVKEENREETLIILNSNQELISKEIRVEALHSTASRGNYNIFKWLVQEEGFDINATNKDGSTPLMWAAQGGHLDFIKAFKVDNPIVDLKLLINQINGWQLTHYAASRGHYNIFKWLVQEEGFDSNATNKKGNTPLMWAAEFGELDFIKAFKVDNPIVDLKSLIDQEDGWQLTHFAASGGHYNIFKWLVQEGFDINAPDQDGSTPLMWAAQFGKLDFIKAFKANNPIVDLKLLIN